MTRRTWPVDAVEALDDGWYWSDRLVDPLTRFTTATARLPRDVTGEDREPCPPPARWTYFYLPCCGPADASALRRWHEKTIRTQGVLAATIGIEVLHMDAHLMRKMFACGETNSPTVERLHPGTGRRGKGVDTAACDGLAGYGDPVAALYPFRWDYDARPVVYPHSRWRLWYLPDGPSWMIAAVPGWAIVRPLDRDALIEWAAPAWRDTFGPYGWPFVPGVRPVWGQPYPTQAREQDTLVLVDKASKRTVRVGLQSYTFSGDPIEAPGPMDQGLPSRRDVDDFRRHMVGPGVVDELHYRFATPQHLYSWRGRHG